MTRRLTDICTPKQWKTIPVSKLEDEGYPVYGANGIVGYYNTFNHTSPTILITCRGATCGRINVCEPYSYVTGNAMCLDDLSDEYDLEFLKYYLESYDFTNVISGSAQPQITKQGLKKVLVPILAIDAQRKQAERFSAIHKTLELLARASDGLDDLVKSRFVEMFGEYDEESFVPLKDTCSIITDGTHQPPKFYANGIPFILVSNIANDVLTYETGKYITEEDYKTLIKRTPIEVGDVLVSAVGSFGHPAVVREERPFCFQRHIAYLKPIREMIDSDYLHAALLSEHSQRYMDQAAKGVAQRTVTLKSLKELRVPLPPLAHQQEFAAFVAHVDKSKFAVQKAVEQLELLKASLMQEYFG